MPQAKRYKLGLAVGRFFFTGYNKYMPPFPNTPPSDKIPNDEKKKIPPSRKIKKKENPPAQKDSITPIEWGFLFTIAALFDFAIQPGLDLVTWFTAGVIMNRLIDVALGFILLIYCLLNGLTSVKQISSIIATFGLEFIGIGDFLPLWVADIFIIMVWHKAELRLANIPGKEMLKSRYMRRVAKKLPFVREKPAIPPVKGNEPAKALDTENPPAVPATQPNNNINSKNSSSTPGTQNPNDKPALERQEEAGLLEKGSYRKDVQGKPVIDEQGRLKLGEKDLLYDRVHGKKDPNDRVDLHHNPHHERNEGNSDAYREEA